MKDGTSSSQSILVAIGFMATGLFSFGLTCVALLLRPEVLAGGSSNGTGLALTHLATLAWLGSLLFAGAYQIGPRLAGSHLWSERLPLFHLVCHLGGLGSLLAGMILGHHLAIVAGSWLLFIGLLTLIYNLLRTGSRRSLWTPSHLAFQTAMFWLAMTGAISLYLLRLRAGGAPPSVIGVMMAIHAHFALFGFLSQALLGVSLRIAPELAGETHPHQHHRAGNTAAWIGWGALNGGLLALFSMALAGVHGAMFGAGIVVAFGITCFTFAIAQALAASHTRLSWSAVTHLSGVGLLVVIAIGALVTYPGSGEASPETLRGWMRTYLSLALLGPFALTTFGAAQSLAPRLIWRLRFEPWKDLAAIPSIGALHRESAGGPVFFSLILAWIYLFIGQVWQQPESIRIAALLLLSGFIWFLAAIAPALVRFVIGVSPRDLEKPSSL